MADVLQGQRRHAHLPQLVLPPIPLPPSYAIYSISVCYLLRHLPYLPLPFLPQLVLPPIPLPPSYTISAISLCHLPYPPNLLLRHLLSPYAFLPKLAPLPIPLPPSDAVSPISLRHLFYPPSLLLHHLPYSPTTSSLSPNPPPMPSPLSPTPFLPELVPLPILYTMSGTHIQYGPTRRSWGVLLGTKPSLSSYALAIGCPVLMCGMAVRLCYGMCSTHSVYGGPRRYGLCGTKLRYGGTSHQH